MHGELSLEEVMEVMEAPNTCVIITIRMPAYVFLQGVE